MKISNTDDLKEMAYIFGSIFTLSNKLQVLGDKFDKNLTVKQWLLLAGILHSGSDSPTISEVADIIQNSRQNVKKMALILEREGFLNINKDPKDARIQRISLTDNCRSYLKDREKSEERFLVQLFSGFSQDEIKAMVNGISKLDRNIEEMESLFDHEEER